MAAKDSQLLECRSAVEQIEDAAKAQRAREAAAAAAAQRTEAARWGQDEEARVMREEGAHYIRDLETRLQRSHQEQEAATSELSATYDDILRAREAEYSRRLAEETHRAMEAEAAGAALQRRCEELQRGALESRRVTEERERQVLTLVQLNLSRA